MQVSPGKPICEKELDMCSRFVTVPACDRQTQRHGPSDRVVRGCKNTGRTAHPKACSSSRDATDHAAQILPLTVQVQAVSNWTGNSSTSCKQKLANSKTTLDLFRRCWAYVGPVSAVREFQEACTEL